MRDFENYVFGNANFVDLFLIQFGHERCDAGHAFGPMVTSNYLFHYVVAGRGQFFPLENPKADPPLQLTTGQGFMILPNMISRYQADFIEPWEYIWFEFNGLKAQALIEEAGFDHGNLLFRPNNQLGESLLLERLTSLVTNNDQHPAFLIGQLYQILEAMIKESAHAKQTAADDRKLAYIRDAVTLIAQGYQDTLTVEELAQKCNLERSYFGRLFKTVMGMTPQNFITEYRMKKSCDLLLDPNLSIKDIAEQVGYHNQFHYSNAFKKYFGIAPTQWRNKNQFY